MYLGHYGLREAPFSISPDTDFYFDHAGQRQALNVLLVAVRGGEGAIAIGGEVGTGKTLLCRLLLDQLEAECITAYLPNPLVTPRELYRAIAAEFGLPAGARASEQTLLQELNRFLLANAATGRRAVVCIDEAQAMPAESLEALRLLSNFETGKRKLIQFVLFGQPELFARLQRHDLRQLRQRITFTHTLEPLARADLPGYVRHRLQAAGHGDGQLFTKPALDRLFRASRGVPRLINILCHKALLAGYGAGVREVGWRQVAVAVDDGRTLAPLTLPPWSRWGMALAAAVQIATLAYLIWGGR